MLASSLTLFLLITARMSGCILFNPLLGRRGIPGLVKGGFILMLSLSAFALTPLPEQVPDTLLALALMFLLELFLDTPGLLPPGPSALAVPLPRIPTLTCSQHLYFLLHL